MKAQYLTNILVCILSQMHLLIPNSLLLNHQIKYIIQCILIYTTEFSHINVTIFIQVIICKVFFFNLVSLKNKFTVYYSLPFIYQGGQHISEVSDYQSILDPSSHTIPSLRWAKALYISHCAVISFVFLPISCLLKILHIFSSVAITEEVSLNILFNCH